MKIIYASFALGAFAAAIPTPNIVEAIKRDHTLNTRISVGTCYDGWCKVADGEGEIDKRDPTLNTRISVGTCYDGWCKVAAEGETAEKRDAASTLNTRVGPGTDVCYGGDCWPKRDEE